MKTKVLNSVDQLTTIGKYAIGNDLVFIPDFKHSLTDLFKNKVYTAAEIAYCDLFDDSLLRYASTWAAKEAVYKAVKQLDNSPLGWKKIEILRDKIAGKPTVIIHQPAFNPANISLTLSHDGDYAWAIAMIEML
jgi:holo-[acyl-carrier protein] synthase